MPPQDDKNDNDEEELAPPHKRQRILHKLDWRLEPSKSFSDWRIVITNQDDEDAAPLGEYNVHKNILALGDRGSVYFASVFETDTIEHQEKCSKIPLSKEGAKAFPHLLDFIYHKEIKVEAPELFLHLYLLKEYFQVVAGRKLDKIISQGIFDACKDFDTLFLLEKTARELNIDTANDIIFTPMKKSFVQYTLEELPELDAQQFVSKAKSSGEPLPPKFLLESVKYLDQEFAEATLWYHDPYPDKYVRLLGLIYASAQIQTTTEFPLKRKQLEKAFGDASSGIWQVDDLAPGHALFLSLCVLALEGRYCKPRRRSLQMSESQKAAIYYFHCLAFREGMSPHEIFSECEETLAPRATACLLSDIRGDILARLTLPDVTFST